MKKSKPHLIVLKRGDKRVFLEIDEIAYVNFGKREVWVLDNVEGLAVFKVTEEQADRIDDILYKRREKR